MQASDDGTQNLVPLTLYYPRPAGVATNLKLTISNPGEAVVWNTNDPEDDTAVLGTGDSTVTLNAAAGDFQQTLWVGATAGTTTLNDLFFTLAAETPGPTTGPTTKPTTNPATPIKIKIISNYNPNGDNGNNGDVTGKSRNWLIGQMVYLHANVVAPPAIIAAPTFKWTVPGNVLNSYTPTLTSGVATPLGNDTGNVPGGGPATGLAHPDVRFFWVSTASSVQPDSDDVSVTVGNLRVNGNVIATQTEKTTFKVYTPASTTSVIHPAPTGINPKNTKFVGLYGDIFWTANVQTTAGQGFAQGEYAFAQLLQTSGSIRFTNGKESVSAWGKNWGLDLSFPYPCNINLDPPTAQDKLGWLTDSGNHTAGDIPGITLAIQTTKGQLSKVQTDWVQLVKNFSTSLMYKPPGPNSVWVPLKNLQWSICYRAKADIKGPGVGQWVTVPIGWGTSWDVIPASFGATMTEPTWNFGGKSMTNP